MAKSAHYTDEKARQIFSKIRAANLQGLKTFAESHEATIDALTVKDETPAEFMKSPPLISQLQEHQSKHEPIYDEITSPFTPLKPLVPVERTFLREQSTPVNLKTEPTERLSSQNLNHEKPARPWSVDLSRLSDKTAWTPASKDRPPVRFSGSEGKSEPQSVPVTPAQPHPPSQSSSLLRILATYVFRTICASILILVIMYSVYRAVSAYCDNRIRTILEDQLGIDRRFWMKTYNKHILADLDRAEMRSPL